MEIGEQVESELFGQIWYEKKCSDVLFRWLGPVGCKRSHLQCLQTFVKLHVYPNHGFTLPLPGHNTPTRLWNNPGSDEARCRAAVSSEVVVLFEQGHNHVVRAGGVGTTPIPYTTLVTRTTAFDITVLARDAGRMHAFTNGEMVSSGKELATPLRVGRFFHLDFSQHVDRDGMGLEIAEMIFYDRYLPRVDREAVTRYLIERYGLQQRIARQDTLKHQLDYLRAQEDAPVALLGTEESIELNVFDDVAAVPWTLPDRTSPPFVHKPDDESATQIRCGSEGTLVRIYLSLRMWAGSPGSKIRVFLLRNGTDYLADHAESGEFGGPDNGLTTVELETTAFLDSGDYLEVITEGVGAEGEVLLVPDESLFFAHAPSH